MTNQAANRALRRPGMDAGTPVPRTVTLSQYTAPVYAPALDSGIPAGMTNQAANPALRRPGRMPGPSAKDGNPQPVHRQRLTDHPYPALDSGNRTGMTRHADRDSAVVKVPSGSLSTYTGGRDFSRKRRRPRKRQPPVESPRSPKIGPA